MLCLNLFSKIITKFVPAWTLTDAVFKSDEMLATEFDRPTWTLTDAVFKWYYQCIIFLCVQLEP